MAEPTTDGDTDTDLVAANPVLARRDALDEALAVVGDRWSLAVVDALGGGPQRFADIAEAVPGVSPNVLSARLKHLEAAGLIVARPYSSRPPRFTYELTDDGDGLGGALGALTQWGAARGDQAPIEHRLCGTPLEVGWYCPSCEHRVEDPDADEARDA